MPGHIYSTPEHAEIIKSHLAVVNGVVVWVRHPRCKAYDGLAAGFVHNGYKKIKLHGIEYRYHRVLWLLTYGEWPEFEIDHIDGDRLNNSISNLRKATPQQNCHNMSIPSHNSTGYKGVCYDKSRGKWLSGIKFDGRRINLGRFDCPELASLVYDEAARRLHGKFAKTNAMIYGMSTD